MNNDPYSRILGTMQRQGAASNGFDITLATVMSINPLVISYNNTRIASGIVLGSCFQTEDDLEEIINKEENISTQLKDILKTVLNTVQVSVGDRVLVQRVENLFYIVGKA